MSKNERNPFVAIAGTIAGISVAIVGVFGIFAPDAFEYIGWVIGALVVLGIALGYFAQNKHE